MKTPQTPVLTTFATLACALLAGTALADIAMPSVFSDHMVLQREMPIAVWGTAKPGSWVEVELSKDRGFKVHMKGVLSDRETGRWSTEFKPISETKGSWTLNVVEFDTWDEDKKKLSEKTIKDVLIGEVWLCGGQSNMEWVIDGIGATQEQKKSMNHPRMRLIKAPHVVATEPRLDIDAHWEACTPETVGRWSAVGYFFGADLLENLDVPIGLISSNWGGTRIEPWIEREDLARHPTFATRTEALQNAIDEYNTMGDDDRVRMARLSEEVHTRNKATYWKNILAKDPGAENDWMAPSFDDFSWQFMTLPGTWEQQDPSLAGFDGVVWFRKTVEIPSHWAGKELVLTPGRIDDSDRTYFNGELVGTTTAQHNLLRSYTIPGNLVEQGRAVLTICVLDPHGAGGMTGPSMHLSPKGKASDGIDVTGEWRWHKGIATTAAAPVRQATVRNPGMNPQAAGALHDGMIAPFVPYTMRGAIWYQGESNAGQPEEYRKLMPLLIESWREDFGENLAFGIVQLAAFKAVSNDPNQGDWALLRDAQLHAVRTVPNTGLAVTTDVGNAKDIHPRNKKAVGDRLAGWALHDVYGVKDAVPSGPIQVKATRDGDSVTVTFDHAQEGLKSVSGDGEIGGFALAGENGRFFWAEANVADKNSVRVWSNDVPDPAIVIYGWQNNPVMADLVNSAGLPASPFRAEISGESTGQ